jgi:cell division protein WhiA
VTGAAGTFTARLRDELAHTTVGDPCCRRAETAVALRLGGALHLRGGGRPRLAVEVATTSGAVARRLHAALLELTGTRPVIEVHEADGLRRVSSVRLRLEAPTATLAGLGLLDEHGRPVGGLAPGLVRRECDVAAALRGALMTSASVSDPRRGGHLELRTTGEAAGRALQALVRRAGGEPVGLSPHGGGWRVVVKSGEAIGTLLARAGAHTAFLEWDQQRLRRELRAEANRATNADRANLSRAVAASGRQMDAIQQAVDRLGWEGIPDDLRAVALARLANPEASLAELGGLLETPLGKSAVHRRILRLQDLASGEEERFGRVPVDRDRRDGPDRTSEA